MARVTFTKQLSELTGVDVVVASGQTVGEVLAQVFQKHPMLRTYVLDDQGGVRKHVAVFLNGCTITNRSQLTDAVAEGDELFVMQALSGG